jgi:hypothetical protein
VCFQSIEKPASARVPVFSLKSAFASARISQPWIRSDSKQLLHLPPILENPAFWKRALPVSVGAWHGLIAANLAPKRGKFLRGGW